MSAQTVKCNAINGVYYLHNTATLIASRDLPFNKGEQGKVIGFRDKGYSFHDEMVLVLTDGGATGWIPREYVEVVYKSDVSAESDYYYF